MNNLYDDTDRSSIPAVGSNLHISSVQDPKQGNMENLLDCSPSDLHLTIERIAAIKRSVVLDLIKKPHCAAVEERYPSMIGCNWEVFPPKQVKRTRVVKRKVKLKIDIDSDRVKRGGVGSETKEPSAVEVEQPGSGPGPRESFETATNSVDSSTQTLPDLITTVVSNIEPSHTNFVNECVSPPSSEGPVCFPLPPFHWITRP